MYLNIDYFDEEFIDGYFSGTLSFIDRNRQLILDFGYDAEFKQLKLKNCANPLYNSAMQTYEPDDILEIYSEYAGMIISDIQTYLRIKYFYTAPSYV